MWSYFFGPTDDSVNQRILKEEFIVTKKNNSLFVSKLLMHDDASILAKIKSATCNRYYMTVTK